MADIWSKDLNIYNLSAFSGFKNRFARKALRQRLNSNPNAVMFLGDKVEKSGENGHMWSRRDLRNKIRDAKNNWNNMFGHVTEDNKEGYYKGNKLSTPIYKLYQAGNNDQLLHWKPKTPKTIDHVGRIGVEPGYINNYQYNPYDFADIPVKKSENQVVGIIPDNLAYYQVNDNDFEGNNLEEPFPSISYNVGNSDNRWARGRLLQQGGQLINSQDSDPTENMLRDAIFSYLGSKDDITSDKALQTVVTAFVLNPESIKEIASNKELVDKGKKKMQLEDQQNNTKMLQLIMQPGALMQLVQLLISNQQQTRMAKMGTKLDYIKNLKPFNCPDGQEIVFMKLGSKVCPVCKKAHAKGTPHKDENGEKIEKDCGGGVSKMIKGIKTAMKCGGEMKKMEEGGKTKVNPNDTIHIGKKIYGLVPRTGYKQLTKEDYRKLSDEDKGRVDAKDLMNAREPEGKTKVKKKISKGQQGLVTELPQLIVNAKAPKRYYYTERELPLGNKRYITSQVYYPVYPSESGWQTYDFDKPIAGRVIYTNPSRTRNPFDLQRDTVYFTNDNNSLLEYPYGYMEIGEDKDLNKAKAAFNRASNVKKVDYSN